MVTLPDRTDTLRMVGFVLLVNVVGALPAVLAGPDTAWFRSLAKPALYPPPAAFGIVWPVLFTLVGVALWLVWRSEADGRRSALGIFVIQMAVNVAWTPVFFELQAVFAALLVIVVLWLLVGATIVAFDRVDRRAAALLVPYLLWVAFAAVLNYRFWQLN